MRIAAVAVTVLSILAIEFAPPAPAGAEELYTVGRHDTLYSIARRFGVSVGALAQANNLADASRIRAGRVLVIPSPGTVRPVVLAPPPPPTQDGVSAEPLLPQAPPLLALPAAARVYVVQAGDTLYHIAVTHGLTVAALQDANHLGASTTLHVGEALVVPGAAARASEPGPDTRVSPPFGRTPTPSAPPDVDAPVTLVPPDTRAEGPPVVRGSLQSTLVARRVTADALRYLGTSYAWGGTTRLGVDCSGLVYAVYSPYVPDLPRVSYDQWAAGIPVEMTALAPGDLVFFNTDGTGPSHVGIYIGDGRFVHPSTSAGRVVVDQLDEPYFLSHYLGARRVL